MNGFCLGKSFNSFLHNIEIVDFFLLFISFLLCFSLGSSWTGLSGGQLVAIRLIIVSFLILLFLYKIRFKVISASFLPIATFSFFVIFRGVLSVISPGNAILQGSLYLLLFLNLFYFQDKYTVEDLIFTLFVIVSLVVFIVDIFIITTGGRGFLYRTSAYVFSSNFILGDKFTISYLHMLFCSLALVVLRNSVLTFILFIVSFLICQLVGCATGIFGLFLIILFVFMIKIFRRTFLNRFSALIIIYSMAIISLIASTFFSLPFVELFITEILHRSADMTGRLAIYPHLIPLFLKQPLFGYGSNGAANYAVTTVLSAPNAQQGLFHILLSFGLVGVFLFTYCIQFYLQFLDRIEDKYFSIYAFICAMSVISLVEINIDCLFFIAIFLIYLLSSSNEDLTRDV